MAQSTSTLLELPFGDVDAARLTRVSVTNTGVVCFNDKNRAVVWLEFDVPDKRRLAAKQIAQRIIAAQCGEVVEPIDWTALGFEDCLR